MNKLFKITILSILIFSSCENKTLKADLIITNADIWTGGLNQPTAAAFAIKADTIIAIGLNTDINKFKGQETKIIDAKGKFIIPGFIDSHVHLLMGGNSLLNVELRDASTKKEFINRISYFAKTLKKETWIVEGNWDHTLWGGELPTKEWIDSFTKDNPVAIYRIDGHMILANSAALKIAGIDKNFTNVENGEIVRNSDGTPTGILKSEAMNLVLNKIPELSTLIKEKAILKAQDYLLANGITSIHDVDSLGGFEVLQKIKKDKNLKIRVYSANPIYKWKEAFKNKSSNSKWLKNGLLKGFVDGSLGSHTAAFIEPYTDKPSDSGIFIYKIDSLLNWSLQAEKTNQQVTIHAIGDKANNVVLNMFEKIINKNPKKDRRFRIEHAQHLAPNDIKRFAELNIIASVQPYHAIDDGRWATQVIGKERIKTTYAFNSLINSNATVTFGSDWPVAPASPLLGIYAAITRQTLDNKNPDGWVKEQKIEVLQALNAYTKNAAFSSFDEKTKGTLEIGKLADFVILDSNITKIKPTKIKDVKILATYVGGKKMYDNENK